MPETIAFSFNVVRLKFHMACPRYSAGGALKIAGSNWLAAFWADRPAARRTTEIANRDVANRNIAKRNIANRNIGVHLFVFGLGNTATVQDSTLVWTALPGAALLAGFTCR